VKDKLYASTRNGSTLEFDKQDLVQAIASRCRTEGTPTDHYKVLPGGFTLAELLSEKRSNTSPGDRKGSHEKSQFSWINFVESSIAGFVQSRLYSGS
jgi:hypothetical protein